MRRIKLMIKIKFIKNTESKEKWKGKMGGIQRRKGTKRKNKQFHKVLKTRNYMRD